MRKEIVEVLLEIDSPMLGTVWLVGSDGSRFSAHHCSELGAREYAEGLALFLSVPLIVSNLEN